MGGKPGSIFIHLIVRQAEPKPNFEPHANCLQATCSFDSPCVHTKHMHIVYHARLSTLVPYMCTCFPRVLFIISYLDLSKKLTFSREKLANWKAN